MALHHTHKGKQHGHPYCPHVYKPPLMIMIHKKSEKGLHHGTCHGEYGDEKGAFGYGKTGEHK